MKFQGIEAAFQQDQGPKYREDRPPDRALLVSNGKETVVLDWIGPALDWWHGGSSFKDDFSDTPAGVWIWEGKISTSEPDDTYLDGTTRELTPDELGIFREGRGEAPWDDSLWLLPEEPARYPMRIQPHFSLSGPSSAEIVLNDAELPEKLEAALQRSVTRSVTVWSPDSPRPLQDRWVSDPEISRDTEPSPTVKPGDVVVRHYRLEPGSVLLTPPEEAVENGVEWVPLHESLSCTKRSATMGWQLRQKASV